MAETQEAVVEMGGQPGIPTMNSRTYRDGYPAVAEWIVRDQDHESYVFRRFDRLSARNLLHLQSQLIELERRLDGLDRETAQSGDLELKQSVRRWETFEANAAQGRQQEVERTELNHKIEKTLRKYRMQDVFVQNLSDTFVDKALLLQSGVAKLEHPSDRVLTAYRNWFHGK